MVNLALQVQRAVTEWDVLRYFLTEMRRTLLQEGQVTLVVSSGKTYAITTFISLLSLGCSINSALLTWHLLSADRRLLSQPLPNLPVESPNQGNGILAVTNRAANDHMIGAIEDSLLGCGNPLLII